MMKHKFKAGDRVRIIMGGHGCASRAIGQTVTIKTCTQVPYTYNEVGYSLVQRSRNWNTTVIGESSFQLVTSTPRSIGKQDILDLMYTTLVSIDGTGSFFQADGDPNLQLSTTEETLAKKNIETLYNKWKTSLK